MADLWTLIGVTVFGKKRKMTCSCRLLPKNSLRGDLGRTGVKKVYKYCQIVHFRGTS